MTGVYRIGAILLAAQLTVGPCLLANPNHKSVDAPLAIHGTSSTPPWHKEASRLYEDARNKLLMYLEREKKNSIKTIHAEDLGKTHLMITQMRRGGNWMEIWGEPAGSDFVLRANVMHMHLGRIIHESQAYPSTQKYIENFRIFLTKTAAARSKALANIEKLCREQKWMAAEAALFRVYDTLEPGTIFLQPTERRPIYEPFIEVDNAIRNAMSELRTKAAAEELQKAIQELTPSYEKALQEIQSAVAECSASGSTNWRGASVTGPELVEKIGAAWKEVQVRAHQYRGKSWAQRFRLAHGGMYHESSMMPSENAEDPIATQYAAFSKQAGTAIEQLIKGAASNAKSETAAGIYVEYLRALAPLTRQINRAEVTAQWENALQAYCAAFPPLAGQVARYGTSTRELLRWRSRLAASQTAAKSADFVGLKQRFHEATLSGKIDGTDYTGLFVAPPAAELQPQLMAASPDTMTVAIDRLLGQKTTVSDVVRIAPDSKAAIARYRDRCYATVATPFPLQADIEDLKFDLLVSEQSPPLTLAAMQAVLTAERNDMLAVGGEISGAHLEAVITRFATLPASAAVLTSLAELPVEKFDGVPLQNMLMRFEIAPRWVRHDYFFTELVAPSPNLTALRAPAGSPRLLP